MTCFGLKYITIFTVRYTIDFTFNHTLGSEQLHRLLIPILVSRKTVTFYSMLWMEIYQEPHHNVYYCVQFCSNYFDVVVRKAANAPNSELSKS